MRKRVIGLLAGADMERTAMLRWVHSANAVWAADGAANILLQDNIIFDVLVGDMDSALPEAMALAQEVIFETDQDSTDCDKLLRLAESRGIGAITIAGIEGDLLDHSLASLQSVAKSSLEVRLALRRGIGTIIRPGVRTEVAAQVGARVSLVPLMPVSKAILEGVKWELYGVPLSPMGALSISNQATKEKIVAEIGDGCALLTVEWPDSMLPHWDY